ncbi:hypothetical protein ABEU97_20405 [Priestia megaterium]
MTTSKTMSIGLQITEYIEKRNTLNKHEGRRTVRKSTGQLGTIRRAIGIGEVTRYHVHFDEMPEKVSFSIHHEDLIILGEVQHNGSNY